MEEGGGGEGWPAGRINSFLLLKGEERGGGDYGGKLCRFEDGDESFPGGETGS